MKKTLIGALVGGIIVFMGSYMSWTKLGTFEKAYHYSENQQPILDALAANLTEEGVYYMPNLGPGATEADKHALMEGNVGKPIATVIFTPAMQPMEMGSSMGIGFLIAFLGAWIVAVVVGRVRGSFINRWLASLALPAFGVLTGVWTAWNWMSLPYHNVNTIMMDTMIIWGIAGLWIAWWMGRGSGDSAAV